MENATENNIGDSFCVDAVPAREAGGRVDVFLAEKTGLSRSRVSALIKGGNVLLNGAPVTDASKKTKQGDRFDVSVPAPAPATVRAAAGPGRHRTPSHQIGRAHV